MLTHVHRLVLYGIGSFQSEHVSRLQLAFSLSVADALNIHHPPIVASAAATTQSSISYYDPLMSEDEAACLAQLGA